MASPCAKRFWYFINRKETKIFLTFLITYACFIQWYGWNEESNFSLVRAIVDENRFEIDSFYNATGDRSVYNGKYYSDKEPGLSFLASPAYDAWEFVYNYFPTDFKASHAGKAGYVTEMHAAVPIVTVVDRGFFIFTSMISVTFFTSVVFSSLTAVLLYKISKYFLEHSAYRILVSVIYGLATLSFPSALHFMTTPTATFFIFLSFYILFKTKDGKLEVWQYFLLAGIAAGFGVTVDRSVVLLAPLLAAYSIWMNKRRSLAFFFGLLLAAMPLILYNYAVFGNPLDLASSYIDRQIYMTAYPQSDLPALLSEEQPSNFAMMSVLNVDAIRTIVEHFHFVPTIPNPYIIMRLLLYPYRGLLFYSPILILAFAGIPAMLRKHRMEAALIVLALLLFLCALSIRRTWWGGHGFGNRYLLPVVPFLMLPLAAIFGSVDKRLLIALILVSAGINFLGLQPAEELAYDWKNMDVSPEWLAGQDSFKILANPLLEHYLPLTLQYGPRSAVFEHLINGYVSIDTRFPPLSKGAEFPFSGFHVPFLSLLPVLLAWTVIWNKEIARVLEYARN